MVFMGMCQNDRFKLVFIFQKIANIRDDQINAEQIGAGEHQAAVNGYGCFTVFDQHHVEAKLAETA
jgi:hypothetical protein